ncbi:MAG: PHP domain-containing protein [Clostridiales bacterium]|nr:PHP domain-containing protein [Clostridiales bacterium]
MSRFYYDLHLHSALSPCGDNDMTPNNIVNMAKLSGLDLIALTDHNSCLNCEAAMQVGEAIGLLVAPGMELCTAEEFHMVCLLPDLERALELSRIVREKTPPVKNRPDIFGDQLVMNCDDEVTGKEEILLVNASTLTVTEAKKLVLELGGACFPAHIDKSAYSILASLGEIPPEADFHTVEISQRGDVAALREAHPLLQDMTLLKSSDAHYLCDIAEQGAWLDLPELSIEALIDAVNGKYPVEWGRG